MNEIICYHYDHSEGRAVRGVNLLTAMVKYGDILFPIGYEIFNKDQIGVKKNKKDRRKCISIVAISLMN